MKEYFLNSIVIGGIIPMIFFGIFALLQKEFSIRISAPITVIAVSSGAILTALIFQIFFEDQKTIPQFFTKGFLLGILGGVVWGIAMIFIAWGFGKYQGNISQIIPIINANALIAVVLSIIFLGEKVIAWKVITGALLIFSGILFLI